jgi:uncharacterized repeat protein (TIGR01451 family)
MRSLMHRAAVAAGAGVVLLGPAVAAIATGTAAQAASGDCTTRGTTVTCAYTYTGGTQSFTVPPGVSSLDVTAAGAAGGHAADGTFGNTGCGSNGSGGPGASVEDTAVPVGTLQGQALTVIVGGPGGAGTLTNGGAGGIPGGGGPGGDQPNGDPGALCDGGGGGGYSGLFSASTALVIGAGGGGGGFGPSRGGPGDTGTGGGAGLGPCSTGDGCGGGGGNRTTGGTGGAGGGASGPGGNGMSLAGSPGGSSGGNGLSSGGGGGGGLFGGGGGGGGYESGGGGGGSSFGITGLTNEQAATAASVTISYPAPAPDLALTNSGAPNPVASGQPLTYALKAANTGGRAATGVKVTDPLPGSAVFGSMQTTQGTCTVSAPNKNKADTVTCHLGTLPAGGTATVTITVTPTTQGILADTAAVTAGNISPADSDDSATATVSVQGT